QQIPLFGGEGEHVAVAVARAEPGQVGALTADTAEDHDGGVAVLGDRVPLGVGVAALGNFVDGVLGIIDNIVVQRAGSGGQAVACPCAGGVEIPHGGVDGKSVFLQSLLEVEGAGLHAAGTGAAVDKVGAGGSEKTHLGALSQGQGVVIVEQQGSAVG